MQNFDGGNIDGQSLRQPVFAIQLENIERENFLAKHQIHPPFKILRYKVVPAFILLNTATLMLIKTAAKSEH